MNASAPLPAHLIARGSPLPVLECDLTEINPVTKKGVAATSNQVRLVYEQDPRYLAWCAERLGVRYDLSRSRWLTGIDDDGGIVFVVRYGGFTDRDCSLSIATDGTRRWASRRVLRAIFELPFGFWKLRRITVVVAANNPASLRMMEHRGRSQLGVTREGVLRDWFGPGIDGHLFGMLANECRWYTAAPASSALRSGN